MEPNLHEYPYTSYEDGCNMGCFMGMCHRAGVKLAVVGDSLQLLDKNNFVLSQVKIAIAQSALKDELGNDITAYIINAGTRENTVVFTKGNGDEIVVTVPYAEVAKYDKSGNEIDDYIIDVQAVGDTLAITRGDGVTYSVTCPYATKAFTDVNNKPLTTYAASMEVSGNNVILKDGMGTVISTITVHFAERAAADENGNNIRESYASVLQAGTTTIKLIAKSGDILSEITVPYSTSSLKDTNGNEFLKDYAETLVVDNDGKRLDLLAHDGTLLSAVTVPFSTLATDATNAIERAEIVGDQLVLTTYGGVVTRLTIPYAIRALNDGNSNEITSTYVHNVVQDPVTGEITFYDAEGTALCALTPRARIAEYDTYNNLIADYIKTLVFDNQSDYLVATHGDGTSDTIVVNYATKAWKDTQGNIIKNTYVAFLANVVDNEGEWVLVAYNGEGSEIFRLKVVANKAQKDQLGNVIDTFYAHALTINGYELGLTDAHGNLIGGFITLPKDGTHIEYEQNPNNTREYDMDLQNVDNQTLDHKMMYFDTDGYDIMFGQIHPDWKELSRISTPKDGRILSIENNDLVIKNADNEELSRVTLPSAGKIKLVQGIYRHREGDIVIPTSTFLVDVNTNKAIGVIYEFGNEQRSRGVQTKWLTSINANSFGVGQIDSSSILRFGYVYSNSLLSNYSLGSYVKQISSNIDGGNYGNSWSVLFIPFNSPLQYNVSYGSQKGFIFNSANAATDTTALVVRSNAVLQSTNYKSFKELYDTYYITNFSGMTELYDYAYNLQFDLKGYLGSITRIECVYSKTLADVIAQTYSSDINMNNVTITTGNDYTRISITQSQITYDSNGIPTNYLCQLKLYDGNNLIYTTDVFKPAGQIITYP